MDYIERILKEYRAKLDASTPCGRFITNLIDRGYATPIDGWDKEKDYNSLPDYYDKDLYKKGQQFCFKYFVAFRYGELVGLITAMLIALPYFAFTKQPSTPRNAIKRYTLTFVYLMRWYYCDLETDKEVWKAFNALNRIHRRVSNAATKHQLVEFTQCHMSLAHITFFVHVLLHPKQFGIDGATRDEFAAFVHFWRVVGHLCGVKDEFNICRESYEETVAICNFTMTTAIHQLLADYDPNFYQMAEATMGGFNYILPLLRLDAVLYQLWYDFNDFDTLNVKIQLNWSARLSYYLTRAFMFCYRFTLMRYITNALTMLVTRVILFVYDRKMLKF